MNTVPGFYNIPTVYGEGDPSLLDISKMWGYYWLQLTNRKKLPLFSRGGPHIRMELLDPTSFQKPRFWNVKCCLYDIRPKRVVIIDIS
jgi:hypothetical protein